MRAKSIVVASGARYRRPEIENLDAFEGRGIWYWASALEATMCARTEVVLTLRRGEVLALLWSAFLPFKAAELDATAKLLALVDRVRREEVPLDDVILLPEGGEPTPSEVRSSPSPDRFGRLPVAASVRRKREELFLLVKIYFGA